MKDFSNASFPPESIGIKEITMDAAVATFARAGQFRACTIDCGEHPSYSQYGSETRSVAKNGAIRTTDRAAWLTEYKLFTKPLNGLKTNFPKGPETNPC